MVRRFFPARNPRQIPSGVRQAIVRRGVLAQIAGAAGEAAQEPTIEDIDDKLIWYSIRDGATLWADANRSIPAVLGSTVGGITDKGGAERHARQTDPTKHMTYQVVDGLPALVPDAVDDYYDVLVGLGAAAIGARHFFIVADFVDTDPTASIFTFAADATGVHRILTNGTAFGLAYTLFSTSGALTTGRRVIEYARYGSSCHQSALDGRNTGEYRQSSGIFGMPLDGTSKLGYTSNTLRQPLRELIGFSRVLTAEERATVLRELTTAWNLADVRDHWAILDDPSTSIPVADLGGAGTAPTGLWRWSADHGVNFPSIPVDGDAVTLWAQHTLFANPSHGPPIDTVAGTVNWRESDVRMGGQPVVDVASGSSLNLSTDDPTGADQEMTIDVCMRLNSRSGAGVCCRIASAGVTPATAFSISRSADNITVSMRRQPVGGGTSFIFTTSAVRVPDVETAWIRVYVEIGVDNGELKIYVQGHLRYSTTAGSGLEWKDLVATPGQGLFWACADARIGDMLAYEGVLSGDHDPVEVDFLRRFDVFI